MNVGGSGEYQVRVPLSDKMLAVMENFDLKETRPTNSGLYFYFETKNRALKFVAAMEKEGFKGSELNS
jgi:hypothetical protein